MTRILSAIILIPGSILVVIFSTPPIYLISIGFIGTLCLYEYFSLIRAMDIKARSWFGYGAFWILLIVYSLDKLSLPPILDPVVFYLDKLIPVPILALIVVAAFITAVWRRRITPRDRVSGVMAELSGIFYIGLFLYPALPIRYEFGHSAGLQWTLLLLLVTWGGDTFALIAGRKIGKRPFAPKLSPKKTKEGALSGFLAGIGIAAVIQHFLFTDLPLEHAIAASILLGIFGQLGDLAESMIKRAAGVKDSSRLVPGHGGVLDRMDSLLFSFPVLYGYLLLIYS
jgi:phosphatidate cytidylyltransferase